MQVSVTSSRRKNKSKRKLNSAFATILIFLLAIISMAFLIHLKKKNIVFEGQIFYFVSAESSKNASILEQKKELLGNLGGASVIFFDGSQYNLIANVYLDLSSANEIEANLAAYYSNVKTIKVKTNKMKYAVIKKIKSNSLACKTLTFMYDFCGSFYEKQMYFLSGKISETEFLTNMVSKRLEIDRICKEIKNDDSFLQEIQNYVELFYMQITNFLNNYYLSKSKQTYLLEFWVEFVINYVEFYNSLE